ncbi:MAG: lytic murein transglycosylase, partial [Rhodanobacter sp.]
MVTRVARLNRALRVLLFSTACFALPALHAAEAVIPPRVFAEPTQDFATWLAELRAEALRRGFSQSTIDQAFALIEEPLPRVIELDRSQPEFVQTFSGYMSTRLSDARIARGQR